MNAHILRAMIVFLLAGLLQAQQKPYIEVSPQRVRSGDAVIQTGTHFTPNRTVLSHLLRPDGTEYNPLRFPINQNGEFSHKIDTSMLGTGIFQLWAEDEASKVESNRTQFSVE